MDEVVAAKGEGGCCCRCALGWGRLDVCLRAGLGAGGSAGSGGAAGICVRVGLEFDGGPAGPAMRAVPVGCLQACCDASFLFVLHGLPSVVAALLGGAGAAGSGGVGMHDHGARWSFAAGLVPVVGLGAEAGTGAAGGAGAGNATSVGGCCLRDWEVGFCGASREDMEACCWEARCGDGGAGHCLVAGGCWAEAPEQVAGRGPGGPQGVEERALDGVAVGCVAGGYAAWAAGGKDCWGSLGLAAAGSFGCCTVGMASACCGATAGGEGCCLCWC
jgi:hypothetical protein